MKKLGLLLMAFGFMCSISAFAQDQNTNDGPRPEMRQGMREQMTPKARAERLAKQLGLTDDEKAKVQAYYEKMDAERKKMHDDGQKLSREDMRTKMEDMRKAEEAEMQKILSPEKFQKFKDMRQKQIDKMRERMQKHAGGDTNQ